MSRWLVVATMIGAVAVSIAISGCSTNIAGMQAPVQHDYDVVDWVPLNGTVRQAFVVTAGYTAAVQNDPDTTPQELVERLEKLPPAATSGRLSEIRLGVRPVANLGQDQSSNGTVSIYSTTDLTALSDDEVQLYGDNEDAFQLVYQANLGDLPHENEQVVINNLPELPSGSLGIVVLTSVGESPSWEFGLARWRAPYGGWKATADEELSGAILFETIYDQSIDGSGVIASGYNAIQEGLNRESKFLFAWLLMLLAVGLAGITVVLLPERTHSTE